VNRNQVSHDVHSPTIAAATKPDHDGTYDENALLFSCVGTDKLDFKGALGAVDVDDGSDGAPGIRKGGRVGGEIECLLSCSL
jgi:hypothetical protein